jgi:hypothetical protein
VEGLGDVYLLQRVDDVLEYVVVQVAGYEVALGVPDLTQRPLGLKLAIGISERIATYW